MIWNNLVNLTHVVLSARNLGSKITSASNLFRDRGARAALPQNCSLGKLNAMQNFANGTPVLQGLPQSAIPPKALQRLLLRRTSAQNPDSAASQPI